MQLNEAQVGAKVSMLDGNEYTIASVREPNAPEGHSEMSLTTKGGITVKGDTRQAVLLELPNDTEEQIEERKRAREEEARKKQDDLERRAEKANLSDEQRDALRNNPQNMARAAASGDQRAVNQMLTGSPETYSGGVIHPAYAGVPANDALRRDNTVYPTDNSPGDSNSGEKLPVTPSANPNDPNALTGNPLQSISGTPSQSNSQLSDTLRRDRGQMTNESVSSDDATLLKKQADTGVSGTSTEAMKNIMERMKARAEEERRGNMTEEEKKEADRQAEEERQRKARENAEFLKNNPPPSNT